MKSRKHKEMPEFETIEMAISREMPRQSTVS